MWMYILLALRNIRRNRSRTVLTLGAIGFSVSMTVLLGGFMTGLGSVMIDDTVKGRTGAIQVHRTGYFDVKDKQPLDYDMEQGGALEARIRAVEGVEHVSARIVFGGLISNGSSSTMFLGQAVDAAQEYAVLPWATQDVSGQGIVREHPHGAVLGLELADAMGVVESAPVAVANAAAPPRPFQPRKDRAIVVQAVAKNGQQNALDVDLVGTINNSNAFEGKRLAYLPLAYTQELLGMEGRVTEYALSVVERDQVPAVAERLRAALGPGFEVQTWKELRPNIAEMVRFQMIVLFVICFVFLAIAVIGVVNTMLMSVLERTREIGTMMAVGVRRGTITWLFLFEAAVLAIIGGLSGSLFAVAAVELVASRGGIASGMPGATSVRHLVPEFHAWLVGLAMAAAVVGTLLAAAYPAWRAARLRPVEALRAI